MTYQRDPTGIARIFALNHYLSTVPHRLTSGNYTAELDRANLERFVCWDVYYGRERIGRMYSNSGTVGYVAHVGDESMTDGGFTTHQGALDLLAKRADKLRAWQEANHG